MPFHFTLRPYQLSDLSVLRDLGSETIQRITNKLSSLDPPPIKPSQLRKELYEMLPERHRKADIVVRLLISLCTIGRQRDIKVDELLEGLTSGIKASETRWTDEEISSWEALQPQLHDLMSISSVWTIVKALDLSYDYAHLFQTAKILTDIRPIFDEKASSIQGAVVSFTLRLYFDSLEGSKNISVALDKDDVKRLNEACERALKKAKTAKNFMLEGDINRTFICGETDGAE